MDLFNEMLVYYYSLRFCQAVQNIYTYNFPQIGNHLQTLSHPHIFLASSAVPANAAYLEQFARQQPERLAKNVAGGPEIIGAVYIHPSANVDPKAKVGCIVEAT